VLSGRRRPVLRLRPGLYGPGDAPRRLARLLATSARRCGGWAPNSSRGRFQGLRERWQFIEPTLQKAPFIKMVPMLGSLGCPYTCSFCIDAVVPYQPMDFDVLREDLRFPADEVQAATGSLARSEFRRPIRRLPGYDRGRRASGQHRLRRRKQFVSALGTAPEASQGNGFQAVLPGIESWFELGGKSKRVRCRGWTRFAKWPNT